MSKIKKLMLEKQAYRRAIEAVEEEIIKETEKIFEPLKSKIGELLMCTHGHYDIVSVSVISTYSSSNKDEWLRIDIKDFKIEKIEGTKEVQKLYKKEIEEVEIFLENLKK